MLWFKPKKNEAIRTEELKELAKLLTAETKEVLQSFHLEVNNRFREVQAQLKIIDQNIELIERKIQSKDLTDRQTYGHIHYKLEELKDLKRDLKSKIKPRSEDIDN
ncbi:MAG: hypothetical protein ACOYL6_09845 [Bacteriovoracaceae bacterium]